MNELPSTESSVTVDAHSPDPIRELERLRGMNRQLCRAKVGAIAAFVLLAILSLVQFLGTFITCWLLHEARQEAARARQDTLKAAGEMKDAEKGMKRAQVDMSRAQEDVKLFWSQQQARAEAERKEDLARMKVIGGELAEIELKSKALATSTDKTAKSIGEELLQKQKERLSEEKRRLYQKVFMGGEVGDRAPTRDQP